MRVLPGGVLGGYYAPQELAFIVREARGARLVDFSGREYIDYILGSGPLVLGHAHPAVVAAVEEQLRKGTTYFQLSEPTLALAEEICRAVPCADQVRFCSTGTEATFFALRLCRAFRRKDTDRPITDYRTSLAADRELHAAFTRAMLERGVVKAVGKFYVSLAHDADDVDRTIEIFAAALEAAAEWTP